MNNFNEWISHMKMNFIQWIFTEHTYCLSGDLNPRPLPRDTSALSIRWKRLNIFKSVICSAVFKGTPGQKYLIKKNI